MATRTNKTVNQSSLSYSNNNTTSSSHPPRAERTIITNMAASNITSNSTGTPRRRQLKPKEHHSPHHNHHNPSSFSFKSTLAILEKISRYTAFFLALMLVISMWPEDDERDEDHLQFFSGVGAQQNIGGVIINKKNMKPRCDEIYMVEEGETLQSISEKCGDPYIVEENPHIHDPDDVFPGIVIKITPCSNR